MSTVKDIKLPALKCLRCGYQWVARQSKYPKYCASCNSPYWNKPKVRFVGQRKKSIPQVELCDDDACNADEGGKQYFGDE